MRVTNSNANAAGPLIVAGYNVSGSVRSDGEPMKGVKFILFSSLVNKEVSIQKEGTKIRLGAAGRASAERTTGRGLSCDGVLKPWRWGVLRHTASCSDAHPCSEASWVHHFPSLANFLTVGRSLTVFPEKTAHF